MPPQDVPSTWVPRLPAAQSMLEKLRQFRREPQNECPCSGFGPLSSLRSGRDGIDDPSAPSMPMWDYIARLDHVHSVAVSTTSLVGMKQFVEHGLLSYVVTHFEEAAQDCAPGTATLLLFGIECLEEHFGLKVTMALFSMLMALVLHARSLACHLKFSVLDEHFAGNNFVPNFGQLPFLFGWGATGLRCHAQAPKIFVYDLQSPPWAPVSVLACAKGLAATEIWVHRQILVSDCRVDSAEEADMFYVPLYPRCLHSQKTGILERGMNWESGFTNATEWYLDLLDHLPHFHIRPQDHIFLFPEEHWPVPKEISYPGGVMGDSIILTPEAMPLHCPDDHSLRNRSQSCFHLPPRTTNTVIIPSFVDSWRASQLKQYNLPLHKRVKLACFMGLGVRKAYSVTENFRGLLRVLEDLPDFFITDYEQAYQEIMGKTIFCLVPKGVGTFSHRLYEAMLVGCIPVILSDDVWLPFPELPWETFSIKWPMRAVDNHSFPTYLRLASRSSMAASMKAAVDQYSCWFDYHSEIDDCAPLLAITNQLRNRNSVRGPSGFWGSNCNEQSCSFVTANSASYHHL